MPLFDDAQADTARWTAHRYLIEGHPSTPTEVSIHAISCPPTGHAKQRGTILLIHGFPQTSYQFRRVITPLSDAGYLVIAPDYRGAGSSSKPRSGYEKVQMAEDLHTLIHKHMGVKGKVHVVGHDIGGMVAHAYAARFADDVASVTWGECPLPGSVAYDDFVREEILGGVWHFVFHWQIDLPEMLTQGKERQYIRSFYDRLAKNPLAISDRDTEHYASMFAQPGGMRAGFDTYRAFHQDKADNSTWVKREGKCKVPCLMLNGDGSFLATIAEKQGTEMYENVEVKTVRNSGHWIAEENPIDFVAFVKEWVGRHEVE